MHEIESPTLAEVMAETTPPKTVNPERWAEAILEARSVLIKRIVEFPEPEITYGELSHFAPDVLRTNGGVGFNQINTMNLLADISTIEQRLGRPMLSVVVVNSDTCRPGAGFFVLARQLGRGVGDEEQFFLDELKRVIDYWRAHA